MAPVAEKVDHLNAIQKNCEEVGHIEPGKTNEMGGKVQEMILLYYQDVRKQAQQSFKSALAAAIVGTLFFGYAAYSSMISDKPAIISIIAGSLVQVISAINFFLYGKAARQFSTFHICLERTNRFLLANSLCDNISCGHERDNIRQDLIKKIADAPMLTLDVISKGKIEPRDNRKEAIPFKKLLPTEPNITHEPIHAIPTSN